MNAAANSRDGHPTGGICPKCGKPLYYASRLLDSQGVSVDVEYCSGGCGYKKPTQASERKMIDKTFADGAQKAVAAADPEERKN